MLRVSLSKSIAEQHFQPGPTAPLRPGQLTGEQTQFALTQLVRLLAPARVLEIGTFFADTARVMAATMADIGAGHLTTIDPFGGHRVPDIMNGWPSALRDLSAGQFHELLPLP